MANLSIVFSGANLAMRISEYLSLTDSMSYRISRLEQMHQKSAKAAFEDALRTNDDALKRHYILRAIDKYRDAAGVEKDDQALFGVYVGLACCHGMLNDIPNRNAAIKKALNYYDSVLFDANDEPTGVIDLAADYDEDAAKIIRIVCGIGSLGLCNLIDYGSKKVNQLKIENMQEKEKEMRNIAEQLRSYI